MRTALVATALAAACFAPGAAWGESGACATCGKETYGTTIRWAGSPSEAAAKAREEEKLVFVLHVSGYFEDAAFT